MNFASRRFLRNLSIHSGNAEAGRKRRAKAASRPASMRRNEQKRADAQHDADDDELALRPAQSGLRDLGGKRNRLGLGAARFEVLQRAFDLLASRFLRVAARWRRARPARPASPIPCASRLSSRPTDTDRQTPRRRRRSRRSPGRTGRSCSCRGDPRAQFISGSAASAASSAAASRCSSP